jgi:hypothetical protein
MGPWGWEHRGPECLAVAAVGRRPPDGQVDAVRLDRAWSLDPDVSRWVGSGPISQPFFRPDPGYVSPGSSRSRRGSSTHPARAGAATAAGLGPEHEPAMHGGLDTPNTDGRCRRTQPVVSTNPTAVKCHPRVALPRPIPCDRLTWGGMSGPASAHNWSGTNLRGWTCIANADRTGSWTAEKVGWRPIESLPSTPNSVVTDSRAVEDCRVYGSAL